LLATILVFLVVIYFQGFRVEIPLARKDNNNSNERLIHPIKLFYTSNMPVILQTALVSNLYFFSQLLHKRFPTNFLVGLFGRWQTIPNSGGQSVPVGGLAYFMSPPRTVAEIVADPFHAIFYLAFILSSCALFSKTWITVTGESAAEVAQQLESQRLCLPGHHSRDALRKKLEKYIPTAAAFGGMCIGALTVFADFLGAIGSGTGILLAVTIIYQYFEMFYKERAQEAGGIGFFGM